MILILGRTASGKDTFAKFLEEQGLQGVLSSTTRAKRSRDDNSHRFVSLETAKEEMKNTVATTEINGNFYYTRKEDLESKDFYIIDALGAKELVSSLPDIDFHIVYIFCDDEQRKNQYLRRCITSEEEYNFRSRSEDKQFTDFENNREWWIENSKSFTLIPNTSLEDLKNFAIMYSYTHNN